MCFLKAARGEIGRLRVHVKRASGLQSADMWGKSDPFVEVVVGTGKLSQKTKTIDDSNDPSWDEQLEFEGDFADLASVPLVLRVMDSDMLSSESLGEVRVHEH